ncbi:hypothetical protein AK830_g8643 [Neonectria ditissima]|uniref:Uncharacterized protein n=1 Tax=Neonectria ditissima TaxID=78410 RepID=A0A0P7B7M4_9HYPO|nr:hypothetical protein AK830_g8643 [Neonectria ditissima]
MCMTCIVHITNCETQRPALISLGRGIITRYPYEEPPRCVHGATAKPTECASHGSCCRVHVWEICCMGHSGESCFGMQDFHVTETPENEHTLLERQGQGIKPPVALQKSKPGIEHYLRFSTKRNFYEAGSQIAHWGLKAKILYALLDHDCFREESGFLLQRLEETFDRWKRSCFEWASLRNEWVWIARLGLAEQCPQESEWIETLHDEIPLRMDAEAYLWPGITPYMFSHPDNDSTYEKIVHIAECSLDRRRQEVRDRLASLGSSDGCPPGPIEMCGKGEPAPIFKNSVHRDEPTTRHMSSLMSPREPPEKHLPDREVSGNNVPTLHEDTEPDDLVVIRPTPPPWENDQGGALTSSYAETGLDESFATPPMQANDKNAISALHEGLEPDELFDIPETPPRQAKDRVAAGAKFEIYSFHYRILEQPE